MRQLKVKVQKSVNLREGEKAEAPMVVIPTNVRLTIGAFRGAGQCRVSDNVSGANEEQSARCSALCGAVEDAVDDDRSSERVAQLRDLVLLAHYDSFLAGGGITGRCGVDECDVEA